MWGRVLRENNAACSALSWLSVSFPTTHKQIGPFWCLFPGGWVCVCSRTLWVSPTNSPVWLGVSPTAPTPTGFFSQRFSGFISQCWKSGLHGLSHSPVVPPGLSALVLQPPPCRESSPPTAVSTPPASRSASSLTPWLAYLHRVCFFGSSGCFLFLNLLLSFFCLCKETQCIYLCLHLQHSIYFLLTRLWNQLHL